MTPRPTPKPMKPIKGWLPTAEKPWIANARECRSNAIAMLRDWREMGIACRLLRVELRELPPRRKVKR